MNKKELGIYIHIPFCKQKCYYCDFISYADQIELQHKYIQAVKNEINMYDFNNYYITTIYIGGGTPSYIESKYITELIQTIKSQLKEKKNIDNEQKDTLKNKEINNKQNELQSKEIEITIEVNPGTVTKEKLGEYKKAGINRLSIGLQTTNNNLLKQIGRIHTYEQLLETYNLAEEVGFKNINIDLMIGLPNQTIKDIKESLEAVIKLNPAHISVYSLIVEEGTKIYKLLEEGKIELPDEELERQMYWYVKNILELNGYKHYEISNFAKEGKESKHNMNCWNQEEYIGFGIAAHSYLNKIRYSNTINLQEYINQMDIQENTNKKEKINNEENSNFQEKIKNKKIEEIQTIEDQQKEFMMLGLRKIEGVNIAKFKQKFGENPIYLYNEQLSELVDDGLINIDLNQIKLTNKGLDLANWVFEEFI